MSYNWENVTWQSRDGSWSRGYFKHVLDPASDDHEDESKWNDSFSFDEFAIVETNFSTEEEANEWEPYGDPGLTRTFPYEGNSSICEVLDLMAFHFKNAVVKI